MNKNVMQKELEVGQTVSFCTANMMEEITGKVLEVMDDRVVIENKEAETLTIYSFDQIVWPIVNIVVDNVASGTPNVNNVPSGTPNADNVPRGTQNVSNVPSGTPNVNNVPSGTSNTVVDFALARNLMHTYIDQLPYDELAQVLGETQDALQAKVVEGGIELQFAVPYFEVHDGAVCCVNRYDDAITLSFDTDNDTVYIDDEKCDSPIVLLHKLADLLGYGLQTPNSVL